VEVLSALVAAFFLFGKRGSGSSSGDSKTGQSTEDIGAGDVSTERDLDTRQIAPGGAVVPQGRVVFGQTVEARIPLAYAFFFGPKSSHTILSPMADGKHAPKYGSGGMPGDDPDVWYQGNGSAARLMTVVSDYPLNKAPNRKGARFAGAVARGEVPVWLPEDPRKHPTYTKSGGKGKTVPGKNGRMPDAAPAGDQAYTGIKRRVRGVITPGGRQLVMAEDTVNFSSLNLGALTRETDGGRKYGLFVGSDEWTALEFGAGESVRQLTKAEAERRLGWVVPGRLAIIESSNLRDESTIRARITGGDGRPGSRDPWKVAPYSGYKQVPAAKWIETFMAGAPLPTRNGEKVTRVSRATSGSVGAKFAYVLGAVGGPTRPRGALDTSGPKARYWFPPTGFNIVMNAVMPVRRGGALGWEWTAQSDDGFAPGNYELKATPNQYGLLLGGRRQTSIGHYPVQGPALWARGVPRSYQGNLAAPPVVPFALEAALLLRALVNRRYVRVLTPDGEE
jgi:hypothetical protein